jgi:DNA-binding FadR family transcriptional regulator
LSQLEQLGLIRVHPGGARVQNLDSASIAVLGPLMALDDAPDPVLVDQFLQTFGVLTALTAKTAVLSASKEQIIQLKSMIMALAELENDFEAMQPQWRELLVMLSTIADNLVIRLIGNDLKTQFVDQMMNSGIQPVLKENAMPQLFSKLRVSLNTRDGELAAAAMQLHFDELRLAVQEAISFRDKGLQKQAV